MTALTQYVTYFPPKYIQNLNTLLNPKGNDIDFGSFIFKISVISSLRLVLQSVCMVAKTYEWFERLVLYQMYNQEKIKAGAVK